MALPPNIRRTMRALDTGLLRGVWDEGQADAELKIFHVFEGKSQSGNFGSRYYNRAGLKDNTANEFTWSLQLVNWNQDNTLWTLLGLQQKITNECKKWKDVTNMCVIAFAMVLKSRHVSAELTIASEKKNKYQVRRDALFSIARLYKNSDNLSSEHRTFVD